MIKNRSLTLIVVDLFMFKKDFMLFTNGMARKVLIEIGEFEKYFKESIQKNARGSC